MLRILANTQESDFSGFVHSMDVKQHFTVVLSCCSLIINEVEHLFTCTIFVSSSLQSLFIAFAHFFLWWVVLPYSFMSVLYVLWMLIAFLVSCNVTQPVRVSQEVVVKMLAKIAIISRLYWGGRVPSKMIHGLWAGLFLAMCTSSRGCS